MPPSGRRAARPHAPPDTPRELATATPTADVRAVGGDTACQGDSPRTENGIAGLSSFVCRRVMPVQRCWSAVRSGTYVAVFFTFFAASFCAERSLRGVSDKADMSV